MSTIKYLKRFGYLVVGILSFQTVLAQENYIPGYIINHDDDTIQGFIDYRNWSKNPDIIKFKKDISNEFKSLKPTDIREFGVQNDLYESGIVEKEIASKYDQHSKLKVDTAFLQIIFSGKKSLFFYKDANGRENFYIKHDTIFELLVYREYLHYNAQTGVSSLRKNKNYLGQLIVYLNDCSAIASKLQTSTYGLSSLSSLFQYYYDCSSSEVLYKRKKEKIRAEIGVLLGSSMTSLEFSGADLFDYLINTDYSHSINLSAGLFVDLVLPRNQGRWSIKNELLFYKYEVAGEYVDFENEYIYTINKTKIGQSHLKINSLVCYKYPLGSLSIFLNGGLSLGVKIQETNYRSKSRETTVYPTSLDSESKAIKSTQNIDLGIVLGTGIAYKDYSLEIKAERSDGFLSDVVGLNSSTKRLFILFGYRF